MNEEAGGHESEEWRGLREVRCYCPQGPQGVQVERPWEVTRAGLAFNSARLL